MQSAVRSLRDVGPNHDRWLAILERLYAQDPDALTEFMEAISRPRHTQTCSLVFHGGRLQYARFEATSGRRKGD